MALVENRSIRTVLRWQVNATIGITVLAGVIVGVDAAISAALGGLVNIVAGCGFGLVASRVKVGSPDSVLRTALRAEAVKIVLIVLLLWLVLEGYRRVVFVAFFSTFIITVLIFTMAFFVRDQDR